MWGHPFLSFFLSLSPFFRCQLWRSLCDWESWMREKKERDLVRGVCVCVVWESKQARERLVERVCCVWTGEWNGVGMEYEVGVGKAGGFSRRTGHWRVQSWVKECGRVWRGQPWPKLTSTHGGNAKATRLTGSTTPYNCSNRHHQQQQQDRCSQERKSGSLSTTSQPVTFASASISYSRVTDFHSNPVQITVSLSFFLSLLTSLQFNSTYAWFHQPEGEKKLVWFGRKVSQSQLQKSRHSWQGHYTCCQVGKAMCTSSKSATVAKTNINLSQCN